MSTTMGHGAPSRRTPRKLRAPNVVTTKAIFSCPTDQQHSRHFRSAAVCELACLCIGAWKE